MRLSIRVAIASAIVAALAFTERPTAQTGLLFQTTFNCPEWDQGMGLSDSIVCGAGDGIAGWGGWTSSTGAKDQITTAANNPIGAGGKGFRHWRGDGKNNNGGGLVIQLPTSVTEMWVRFYMRYQAGFAWTSNAPEYTKEMLWELQPVPGAGGQFVFGFNGGFMGVHPYSGTPNYNSSMSWSQINGRPTGDGNFHCYEFHLKVDTPGANNGIIEIFVDGVRYLNVPAADLSDGATRADWSEFILGDNSNNPSNGGASFYTDYDDIAVSTTGYIGPINGTPVLSAPLAPTNLRVVR